MPGSAVPMGMVSPSKSRGMGPQRAKVVASVGPYTLCRTVGAAELVAYQRRMMRALSCSPPTSTCPMVAKQSGTCSTTALNKAVVMNNVSTRRSASASASRCALCAWVSSSTTQMPPVRSGTHTSKLSASKAGLARQAIRAPGRRSTYPWRARRSTPSSVTSTPLG